MKRKTGALVYVTLLLTALSQTCRPATAQRPGPEQKVRDQQGTPLSAGMYSTVLGAIQSLQKSDERRKALEDKLKNNEITWTLNLEPGQHARTRANYVDKNNVNSTEYDSKNDDNEIELNFNDFQFLGGDDYLPEDEKGKELNKSASLKVRNVMLASALIHELVHCRQSFGSDGPMPDWIRKEIEKGAYRAQREYLDSVQLTTTEAKELAPYRRFVERSWNLIQK